MFNKIFKPKSCNIKFHLLNDFYNQYGDDIPKPGKSSRFLPDWYKKIDKGRGGIDDSLTVKACTPVKDLMTAGYIIPHWQDAHIKHNPETREISFLSPYNHMSLEVHPNEQVDGCPNKRAAVLKFATPWIIETPPGYSCLFIQPQFHENGNDISMIPAIVDTDSYFDPVNFTFFYHPHNIETRIKTGDPLIQVIPFKRESWTSKVITNMSNKSIKRQKSTSLKINKTFENRYVENYWCPKSYK